MATAQPIISEKTYITIYNHLTDVRNDKIHELKRALEAFGKAYDDALDIHDKQTWGDTLRSLRLAQVELDEARTQLAEVEAYGDALGY